MSENIERYLLSEDKVGDQLDLEMTNQYLRSDGTWTSTIDVYPLLRTQLKYAASLIRTEGIEEGRRQVLGRLHDLDNHKEFCTNDFDQAVQELIRELEKELEGQAGADTRQRRDNE